MLKRTISIGKRKIGDNSCCFIIAEAGVNHNGSLELAKKMVDVAKSAGADAVKFQTFKTEEFVTLNAPRAHYQKKTVPGKSQFEMLKSLELSEPEFRKLYSYCNKKNIIFLSTPFDFKSADFLYKLGISAFKISSGDLTNIPLLLQIAKYKKPIILSTGMATLREVEEAVEVIYSSGNRELILLHCTSNYPTEYEDVNLRAMATLRKKFNLPIGYSDHTKGIEVAIAAVAMGACLIEKHFTLDRNLLGPDHNASVEPGELKKLIFAIRNIEMAKGTAQKKPQKSEYEMRKIIRRSIVASCDIPKGTRLTLKMLALKRPGTGIKIRFWNKLLGKKTKVNIKKDQLLSWGKVG